MSRWSTLDPLPKHGTRDGAWRYDATAAEGAVRWLAKYLRIPEGERAGRPFDLERWQADRIVRPLYGWLHASTRRRRFSRVVVGIPRGNGKSTLGAGLGVKGLVGDGAPTPKVLGAGTDRENAGIIFSAASTMVRADKRLLRRLMPVDSRKRIVWRKGAGVYWVMAAEAQHAHGYHPTTLIVDDLQAQTSAEFITVLDTSQVTVADPLRIDFMTAGHEKESVGGEVWSHCLAVQGDPTLDEGLLPVLYYADAKDDFDDRATWLKANPNLGVTVREDFIRDQVATMKQRPSKGHGILRLHFNVWTEGEFVAWLEPQAWTASGLTPTGDELTECYVGVSAASATDLACVVYVFPGAPTTVEMEAFIPEDNITRVEQRDRVSYRQWITEGWLRVTDGNTRDDDAIVKSIEQRVAQGAVVNECAVNPRGAVSLMRALDGAGLPVTSVLPSFGQMSGAMDELERLVMAGDLAHGGNHLLSWMMRNLQAKANPDGDKKPDAERSSGPIVGPVALLMALSRVLAGEEAGGSWAAV